MAEDRHAAGDEGTERYASGFLQAMREAVAAVSWQISGETNSTLECLDGAGEKRIIGLENFYRRVKDRPSVEWAELLRGHLLAVAPAFEEEKDDLNAVADRVFPHVGLPFKHIPGMSVWSRPIEGTDLIVMLVVTSGGALNYVNQEQVEASGRSGAEWYTRSVANLHAHTPPGSFRVIEENSGILACSRGDAHDASRSLIVEAILPEEAPEGVLVGVPSRDALIALPVHPRTLQHLALLKVFLANQHQDAAYPITPDIFWVRQGRWRRLGVEVSDQGIQRDPAA